MGYIKNLKRAGIIYVIKIRGHEESEKHFTAINELAEFFNENKRLGEVVGYVIIKNRPRAFNDEILDGSLAIEWEDEFGYGKKGFANVNTMVDFLKEYPLIGDFLGFKPKT